MYYHPRVILDPSFPLSLTPHPIHQKQVWRPHRLLPSSAHLGGTLSPLTPTAHLSDNSLPEGLCAPPTPSLFATQTEWSVLQPKSRLSRDSSQPCFPS